MNKRVTGVTQRSDGWLPTCYLHITSLVSTQCLSHHTNYHHFITIYSFFYSFHSFYNPAPLLLRIMTNLFPQSSLSLNVPSNLLSALFMTISQPFLTTSVLSKNKKLNVIDFAQSIRSSPQFIRGCSHFYQMPPISSGLNTIATHSQWLVREG
jgi:hypothetical protein